MEFNFQVLEIFLFWLYAYLTFVKRWVEFPASHFPGIVADTSKPHTLGSRGGKIDVNVILS